LPRTLRIKHPVALIASIYKTYTAENNRPAMPMLQPAPARAHRRRRQKYAGRRRGKIDWDVFVDGNNWELTT